MATDEVGDALVNKLIQERHDAAEKRAREEERPAGDIRGTEHQAKRLEAVTLRLAGLTYEQIADRMDISPSWAMQLVELTLTSSINRQVSQMRSLENQRLDRAQAAIWPKVLEGNMHAVDVFLRLSGRRAKMNGLDAPTAISVSVTMRQEMDTALNQLESLVKEAEYIRAGDPSDNIIAGEIERAS